MEKMLCFQCEQTAKGIACTTSGVCGKLPEVSHAQDLLTCEMIALATAASKIGDSIHQKEVTDLLVDGLFTTVTNVSFNAFTEALLSNRIKTLRNKLNGTEVLPPYDLFHGEENEISLKSTLLFGLRGMAAYAHHARMLGFRDEDVDYWFIKGMAALGKEHSTTDWLDLLMECGKANLSCMALLDRANTESYGDQVPTEVLFEVEPGPFIVVTGHDLHDLKMLLEQTKDTGVAIYTHSEMLPAHAYPKLKAYPHLKGNFGTAWQNQQKEFKNLPAPILFTTNCLMPPKSSYADRVYTTSVVSYPEMKHIPDEKNGTKDFTPMIEQALALGGFKEKQPFTGINGGKKTITGFGRQTILDNAPTIIEAVKSGAIKQFFLVGGCDGANPGRNYYTEFVKQAPEDSVILTLACGKYRFNDLDLGQIGPFPRILDMGQCNDAYGAIQVALALADAFSCEINELPLTLILSWYEQKAVSILLTLLSLGVKNIYIGPSLPAFLSNTVLTTLVNTFGLQPITTPEADLTKILG
ncbi:hydroxylamine reductase [Listeria sp. PSOL-1]|uniref:hydroxylamine reductase n=1 Tax=Listeria sp. PSOL-1 TaxID=1844999 RepID=UPI0013D5B371|nr:hydroxylamine reductase [Listeria sp. PSOL-1]